MSGKIRTDFIRLLFVLFCLITTVVSQNVVANPGCELNAASPFLPPWSSTDSFTTGWTTTNIRPHTGTRYFATTCTSGCTPLTQTLTLVSGQNYILSFWSMSSSGTADTITAQIGATTLVNAVAINSVDYTQFFGFFTASSTSMVLSFSAVATAGTRLDDVSVIPNSVAPTRTPTFAPTHAPSFRPTGQPSSSPTCQPSSQPSRQPTAQPISKPTGQPSRQPSNRPTSQPSTQPTSQPSVPTGAPSSGPSTQPSTQPTGQPSGRPSNVPTSQPSRSPSAQPTRQPSSQPSGQPTLQPVGVPTSQPSRQPSAQPSRQPTSQPVSSPTTQPSTQPSRQPLSLPTSQPTTLPTNQPSRRPSSQPSSIPTRRPTMQPTGQPSGQPTRNPSTQPTSQPTAQPSRLPTAVPTTQPSRRPSEQPTSRPTRLPSSQPSSQPTDAPSSRPSRQPTTQPSSQPSVQPVSAPTTQPTSLPTTQPSSCPSSQPSNYPTRQPSAVPSPRPTTQPTKDPTSQPSSFPTSQPSKAPSVRPSSQPTNQPTVQPTRVPSAQPSRRPTSQPSAQPSCHPSSQPSSSPTSPPTGQPTVSPSGQPTQQPTGLPSSSPSAAPSCLPTTQPSGNPSGQPVGQPSALPSSQPSGVPTAQPSSQPSHSPTSQPSTIPTRGPSAQPSSQPTSLPTNPSSAPTRVPSSQPSSIPTNRPTLSGQVLPDLSFSFSGFPSPNVKVRSFLFGLQYSPVPVTNPLTYASSSFVGNNYIIFGQKQGYESPVELSSSANFTSQYIKYNAVMSIDDAFRSMDSTGNFNRDDFKDVLLGDPSSSLVYIFFGRGSAGNSMNQAIKLIGESPKDYLGWSVSALDFNGDGIDDIFTCALLKSKCYVILGHRNLPAADIPLSNLTSNQGFSIRGDGTFTMTNLGLAASSLGDINHDGYDDLAITAMQGANTIIFVIFGNAGKTNVRLSLNLPSSVGFVITTPKNSLAGISISDVGDVNRDGYDDFVVGSVPINNGPQTSFAVYGRSQFPTKLALSALSIEEGFVIHGGGFQVNNIGDVNDDGYTDILVSNYQDWQNKRASYVLAAPSSKTFANLTRFPTSSPTAEPSFSVKAPTSAPSKPVVLPTSAPTSRPSHPTPEPTPAPLGPTPAPSIVPTASPSFAPSITPSLSLSPSKVPTAGPSLSIAPFPVPTLLPTPVPSVRPSPTPTTAAPSFLRTSKPSYSSPTSYPTSSRTKAFITTPITGGGQYQGNFSYEAFVINSDSDVIISGKPGGFARYVIVPASFANVTVTITNFDSSKDIIDLSQMPRGLTFEISGNPLTIKLSSGQIIVLSSHSSYDLTQDNLILPGGSSSSPSTANGEEGRILSVDNTVIVAIATFLSLSLLVLLVHKWRALLSAFQYFMDPKKKSTKRIAPDRDSPTGSVQRDDEFSARRPSGASEHLYYVFSDVEGQTCGGVFAPRYIEERSYSSQDDEEEKESEYGEGGEDNEPEYRVHYYNYSNYYYYQPHGTHKAVNIVDTADAVQSRRCSAIEWASASFPEDSASDQHEEDGEAGDENDEENGSENSEDEADNSDSQLHRPPEFVPTYNDIGAASSIPSQDYVLETPQLSYDRAPSADESSECSSSDSPKQGSLADSLRISSETNFSAEIRRSGQTSFP